MHDDSHNVPATQALPALDREGPLTCHDTEELMALGMGCDLAGRTQEAFEVHVLACASCAGKVQRFKQALAPLSVVREAEATTMNAREAADLWASIHSRIADSVRAGQVVDHGLRAIAMPSRSRRDKAGKVHAMARARRFNRGAAAAALLLTFGMTMALLAQTGMLSRALDAIGRWGSGAGNGTVAANDPSATNGAAPVVIDETNADDNGSQNGSANGAAPANRDGNEQPDGALVETHTDDFAGTTIPHGATPATPRRAPGMTAMTPEVPAGGVPFASPRGGDPATSATVPPAQFGRASRGSLRPSGDGDGMMDF